MKTLKNNYWRLLLISLFLVLISAIFYWYEWRPSQIRHDCSWINRHIDAKPATSAVEADHTAPFDPNLRPMPAKPATPAKDWIEPASHAEYERCLHDYGLME